MKVKLSKNQLEGFHTLLNVALKLNKPYDMASKLLFEIVDGINDKIARKLKKLTYGSEGGYSLSLTSIEAKALFCWIGHIDESGELSESYKYESIVSREVVAQIDREYA